MLDHVPKANGDEPAKYAIGSQRKLAAITGASYRCDTVKEFAKGRSGILKLVVAKDRLGNRPKGATACEVHVDGHDEAVEMAFRVSDAQAAHDAGQPFRPTHLMELVSRWLEGCPGASKAEIENAVRGRGSMKRLAIDTLVSEGYVTATALGSHATARVEHTVVRPFREADPVDNVVTGGASSASSHLRPASSRTNQTPPKGASSPSSLPSVRQGRRDEAPRGLAESFVPPDDPPVYNSEPSTIPDPDDDGFVPF